MPATPETFTFVIKRIGLLTYLLTASHIIPFSREKAFEYFKDPKNLCDITPVWLDFCMIGENSFGEIRENSEFEYSIKWMGIKMQWKSRIVHFHPPERFTDIQIKGPYRSWVHHHILEEVPEGTRMKDEITYTIPFIALPLHSVIVKKQLEDIFHYRAEKIAEWTGKRD
jgi:ligand-binding SRPBCC domain-containing protein